MQRGNTMQEIVTNSLFLLLLGAGVFFAIIAILMGILAIRDDRDMKRRMGVIRDDEPKIPRRFQTEHEQAIHIESQFFSRPSEKTYQATVSAWEHILQQESMKRCREYHTGVLHKISYLKYQYFQYLASLGNLNILNDAIELNEKALQRAPKSSEFLPICLTNHGNMLSTKYAYTGNRELLTEAIAYARKAVTIKSKKPNEIVGRRNNLATKLSEFHIATGNLEALSEAIEIGSDVVRSSRRNIQYRLNLANSFLLYYEATGSINYLEKSVEEVQVAMKELEMEISGPPRYTTSPIQDEINQASYFDAAANVLISYYQRTREIDTLKRALDYANKSRNLPLGHPRIPIHLNNLSRCQAELFLATSNKDYLRQAIENGRRAVAQTPDISPDKSLYLANLANSLYHLYEFEKSREILLEAIQVAEKSLDLTPDDTPAMAGRKGNLANMYETLAEWDENNE